MERLALSGDFNALGVRHPDDMSGIIFETFWCKLHGQPFNLDARVKELDAYWRSMEEPQGGSPIDGAKIAWVIVQGSGPGTVHLGISTSDRSYWRYEFGCSRPIEPANENDRQALDELRATWERIGTKLEDIVD